MGAPACGKLKPSDAAAWDVWKSDPPQVHNDSKAGVRFSDFLKSRKVAQPWRGSIPQGSRKERENGSLFRT